MYAANSGWGHGDDDQPDSPESAIALLRPDFLSGAALPTGVITFLLTDIQDSTRLWDTWPREMRIAMQQHDRIFETIIARHSGTSIKPRGEGDSRFAVFRWATDAVAAAAEIQLTLHDETWDLPEPIRVHLGLHSGEADVRKGDYYGGAVNRCARIRSLSHGGQILLSGATYDVVQDAPTGWPAGTSPRPLGEFRLRGLARPERIFELTVDGVPSDFPPLAVNADPPTEVETPDDVGQVAEPSSSAVSSPQPPLTLARAAAPVVEQRMQGPPEPLTSFVGRQRELDEIQTHLHGCRLLTLAGTGGIGKTRLSVEIARRYAEGGAIEVAFVELAPVGDASLVIHLVASRLGIPEQPNRPVVQTLVDSLRERKVLIVLDNCEHVIDACAQLAQDLLSACPGVTILATSREPLRIAGETVWRVPSLSTPDVNRSLSVDQLSGFEATRLFIERATAALPTFSLTESNAAAVAQICDRLDGIPLALELAAARVRVLSPSQIAERLDDRFRLLVAGSRLAVPRQQTLQAAVAWSYDLLPEIERRLFTRLSVFSGGWSLEAAEAVCSGDGLEGAEVLDLLEQLVDKSLVLADQQDPAARYRLLETLRHFGRQCLGSSGESETTCSAHASFFLALAERAELKLIGTEQGAWLSQLEEEHDNLRAALRWAIDSRQVELGLRLAGSLWRFWLLHGYLTEGRRWLVEVLGIKEAAAEARLAAVRAKALNGAGVLACEQGDYSSASALTEEGLALFKQLGDKAGTAWAVASLGLTARYGCDYGRASALLEESLVLFRELGDRAGEAWSLLNLGGVAREQGEYARAMALYEASLGPSRELGDKAGSAWSLLNLGGMARDQGEYPRASALYEESLALFRELGDKPGSAWAVGGLGLTARYRGDYERAAALLGESVELCRSLGDKRGCGWSLLNQAGVATDVGDFDRAESLLTDALALFRQVGDNRGSAWSLANLGLTAREQARYEQALSLLTESLTLSDLLSDKAGRSWALCNLGSVYRRQGDIVQATGLFAESLALAGELGDKRGVMVVLEEMALASSAEGQLERATCLFSAAQTLRGALGTPRPAADQERWHQGVERARAGLGELAFAEAWAQGPSLLDPPGKN